MIASGTLITPEMEVDWLRERRSSIGASEAAAAIGESPWQTPVELWQEKTGRVKRDDAPTEEMIIGKLLEPRILQRYTETTGFPVLDQQAFHRHPVLPFLTATLDGRRPDGVVVEAKSTDSFAKGWGEEGSDEVPAHYLIQVHHQMMICDAPAAEIVALFGKRTYRIYHVPRNQALCDVLLDKLVEFWNCVEAGTPPDWGALNAADLAVINPECFGEVELPGNVVEMAREYAAIGERVKELEERQKQYKVQILAAMGNHREGLTADGRRIVRRHLQRVKESTRTVAVKEHVRHHFTLSLKDGD